jgi:predicted dehydrogenase
MLSTRRTFLTGATTTVAGAARPAANDRITVGIIGCGARAHELMQSIMQHPQVEIVGLVDAYKGRVERALERTGGKAKAYKNHHDLLANSTIDAVVVATPDHLHKQIIIDAIRAGKDVYTEKPLTYRSSEGREIIQAARSKERMVQVGSQGVSSEAQRRAKQIIRAGKLGKVTVIRAAYNRNTASGAWIYPIPPDASPKTVDREMFLGPAPKRPIQP